MNLHHHKHMPTLAAAMTPFPYVIDANATISEAQRQMLDHAVHHLPVQVNGSIDSIVSQRDIQRAQLIGHRNRPDEELLVGDVCHPQGHFADIHDPLDKVLEVMAASHIEAILVLKEGTVTGIMTHTDVCNLLAAFLQQQFPVQPTGDDAA